MTETRQHGVVNCYPGCACEEDPAPLSGPGCAVAFGFALFVGALLWTLVGFAVFYALTDATVAELIR